MLTTEQGDVDIYIFKVNCKILLWQYLLQFGIMVQNVTFKLFFGFAIFF